MTQTNDIEAILAAVGQSDINGHGKFFTAIKVGQLSLKHRQNKSQRQRIITFVGHPLLETLEQCEDLGKRLRRNNVAIDVINFANPDNVPKLEALVNAANNQSNSHFMDVPMGCTMITDVLFTSPILGNDDVPGGGPGGAEGGAAAGGDFGGPAGGQFAEYGGINPNTDPDLAMALKVSLEEERARAAQNKAGGKDEGKGGADANVVSGVPVPTDAPMETQMGVPADPNDVPMGEMAEDDDEDQDELLKQAIAMSL